MCARVAHAFTDNSNKERTIAGRNMDWFEPMDTDMWVYIAQVKRNTLALRHKLAASQ